jgi:polyhydroxyalkanoate synthesis regulator phasin
MNPDLLPELAQRGFRFTLGATSAFFESLQDSQKRDENFNKLTTNFDQLAEEWIEKGAATEEEARTFVDTMIFPQGNNGSSYGTTVNTTAVPVASPNVQAEIKDLTAQVIALREELETLSK